MLDFIKHNVASIMVVLLFIMVLLFLYKKGKKGLVKQIILSLVTQAEKTLGSGTGPLKYAMVVEELYKILPGILTTLFTMKEIDDMIEAAVRAMKEYLSKDKDLLGYDIEYGKYNTRDALE